MAAGGYGGAGSAGTKGTGGTYGTAATAGTGDSGGGGGASGGYAGYAGGTYATGVQGGAGGQGGANGTANGLGSNSAAIMGGTGGAGTAGMGATKTSGAGGGGGGAGGYGLVVTATSVDVNDHFTNSGNVNGGTGGAGGAGAAVSGSGLTGGTGGEGGGGGSGVRLNDANATLYNSAEIYGGKGGLGGAGGLGSSGAVNGQAGNSGAGGDGIDLVAGTLVNQASGSIVGGSAGRPAQAVLAGFGVRGGTGNAGAATTVINYGRISGGTGFYGDGVGLKGAGSSLVNRGSGSISGGSNSINAASGLLSFGAFVNGSLQNLDSATIKGAAGVSLSSGGGQGGYAAIVQNGSLSNASAIEGGAGGYGRGSLAGGYGGTGLRLGLSTGINSGTIAGGAGGGSYSGAGGVGGGAVDLEGGYLKNTGTISGGAAGSSSIGGASSTGGYGINLGYGRNASNAQIYSSFYNSGTVSGGQGSGGGAGGVGVHTDYHGKPTTLINNGTIARGTTGGSNPVQADSVYDYAGVITIAIGSNGSFQGAIDDEKTVSFNQALQRSFSANATVSTNIIGAGNITKLGSGILTLSSGLSTFSGGTTIDAGTLDLDAAATTTNGTTTAGAAGTGAITFAGVNGAPATLALESAAQPRGAFSNTLNNFGDYDELDLKGLAFSGGAASVSTKQGTTTLEIRESGVTETFTLTGSYANSYVAQSDSNGGTLITDGTVCFCSGTRIRVLREGREADVPVEHLVVGDLVVTASGVARPIRWLGHRTTRCDRHPSPRRVWPVRVAASAFGVGFPYADLWLSPGHALCLGNALVPVRGLIDGERIVQVERDEVTYWHVELDGHDVLLANGLPAESCLDTGNRRGFANAAEVMDLHFDEAPAANYDGSGYCLPMVESGPRLSAIRARFGLGALAPTTYPPIAATSAVYLVADDIVVAPLHATAGELRFLVPAAAAEVRLVSPRRAGDGDDIRRLGLLVTSLAVSDGSGWCEIALDDPSLFAGFHDVEREAGRTWRWTDGEGHLSQALLCGFEGGGLLRVTGMFDGLRRHDGREASAA